MSESKKATVFYHANCTDGFTAAYFFWKFMQQYYEEVDYAASKYGRETDLIKTPIKDRDVFILDFSFNKTYLETMAMLAKEITLIDHHKTAKEDLAEWIEHPETRPPNVNLIFDMERSGAGLAWDTFCPFKEARGELANYVEDRDLWKFALAASKPINAFINSKPRTFEAYWDLEEYLESDKSNAIEAGQVISDEHQRICEDIANQLARECIFDFAEYEGGSSKGLIANCTGHFASEVGNILAKRSGTFGATSYTDANGDLVVSLRSIGDYDVSKIAKQFGGGGHKNASGFRVPAEVTGTRLLRDSGNFQTSRIRGKRTPLIIIDDIAKRE